MKGSKMGKISKFDAADYLKTPEAIAAYLTEALATDDAAYICAALDTVARAKGMTNVSKETGLSRESLYKSFSGSSKPEFDTVRKVVNSFGVRLGAEPAETMARTFCVLSFTGNVPSTTPLFARSDQIPAVEKPDLLAIVAGGFRHRSTQDARTAGDVEH